MCFWIKMLSLKRLQYLVIPCLAPVSCAGWHQSALWNPDRGTTHNVDNFVSAEWSCTCRGLAKFIQHIKFHCGKKIAQFGLISEIQNSQLTAVAEILSRPGNHPHCFRKPITATNTSYTSGEHNKNTVLLVFCHLVPCWKIAAQVFSEEILSEKLNNSIR